MDYFVLFPSPCLFRFLIDKCTFVYLCLNIVISKKVRIKIKEFYSQDSTVFLHKKVLTFDQFYHFLRFFFLISSLSKEPKSNFYVPASP